MTAKALVAASSWRYVCALGALVLMGAYLVTADAQTVYKSVDEEGHLVYTDRPPEGYEVETVEGVDIERTDRAQVNAANSAQASQRAAEGMTDEVRQQQDAEEAAMQAAADAERQANCDIASERLNKYTAARRLYRDLADGEREWLSDDEIDAARTKAALSVEKWCG